MVIVEAEAIPYWLPFRHEYITARGRLARREMALLRLRDAEGREAWGEAVPLSLRGGAGLERVVTELAAWAATAIEGDRRYGDSSWRSSAEADAADLSAPARCAVLTALGDLEAKRREVPLWQLLGAERCEAVPCNATLISGSPEAVAADALRWAEDGFTTFKLKVGLSATTPERADDDPDLAMIAAVRGAVGPEARLRLDANGAWGLDRAEAVLRAASLLGIELVEQPVAGLAEMASLRRRLQSDSGTDSATTRIPIAADESVNGADEARAAAEAGACDLATVKLSKVGQLRPDLGGALPFYLSSALDGPVGIAAAAHAYQALSEAERATLAAGAPLAQGLATQRLFAATIASRECELGGHLLHLPPGPGLGVEIDLEALAAHRI